MIFFFIGVVVAIAVALITLDWFFRDGDESTESFREYYENSCGPFSYRPWWSTKFGLWLGVSGGAGFICAVVLRLGWDWLRAHF